MMPTNNSTTNNPFDNTKQRSRNPFDDDDGSNDVTSASAPPIIVSTSSGVELHAATGGFSGAAVGGVGSSASFIHTSASASASAVGGGRGRGRVRPMMNHRIGSSSSSSSNALLLEQQDRNYSSSSSRTGAAATARQGGGRYTDASSMLGAGTGAAPSTSSPIWISRNVEWPVPHTLAQSVLSACADGNFSGSGGYDMGELSGAASPENLDPSCSGNHADDASGAVGGGAGSYITGLFSRVLPTTASSSTGNQGQGSGVSSGINSDWTGGKMKRILSPSKHCVASSNGWIIAAIEVSPSHDTDESIQGLRLISRWNVRRGTTHTEETIVPLPQSSKTKSISDSAIKSVFIDPTGCHVLVSAGNGEAYYLHSSSKKARKLQGFVAGSYGIGGYITSIAWDREKGTEGSTKHILLGTSNGKIYQVTLLGPNSEHTSDEAPLLLHELDCDEEGEFAAVSGLHFERASGGRAFVIAVTSGIGKRTRIHRFRGNDSSLQSAFAKSESNNIESSGSLSHSSFVELPGSIDFAELCVCGNSFALRSDAGIYYGIISHDDGGGIQDSGILTYDGHYAPSSIAITPHHFISLNDDGEVLFISRISLKVIQREIVISSFTGGNESGELLTDVRRPDQVWLRQGRTLLHISSTMEDRDVWSLTLEKCIKQSKPNIGENEALISGNQSDSISLEAKTVDAAFDIACLTCTNTAQEAVVASVRGEYHVSRGRPEMAAKYLASSPSVLAPFITTTLRLCLPTLHVSDNSQLSRSNKSNSNLARSSSALIIYLSEKLRVASEQSDTVACALLGAWICELILHEKEQSSYNDLYEQSSKLSNFLMKYAHHLDPTTTIRILSSHDASAFECADYAAASGDVGTAINAVLGDKEKVGALKALKILANAPFEKAEPYYYKHASKIIERAPLESSKNFLSRFQDGLQPTKLLPALMAYERTREIRADKQRQVRRKIFDKGPLAIGESKENEIPYNSFDESDDEILSSHQYFEDNEEATVKYLDGVIQLGCESTAIFSYLISILVSKEDEEPLFKFISQQMPFNSRVNKSQFKPKKSPAMDLHFILRTVLKSGRHFRSTVKIYMGLGMRQQAVELALKVDPSLARELARDSTEESERKQLWSMIAKNAALEDHSGRDTVGKVLAIIKECGQDTLSIEDVLPFLPDSTQIDQFREEICEALTAYSSKIDQLMQDMSECDQACETLRSDITRLGKLGTQMRSDARCAFTGKRVLNASEPFYVFPSGYVVLESVLKTEVLPFLNDRQKSRVQEIERDMQRLKRSQKSDMRQVRSEEESLQSELNGLIAAECPLTGRIMVESVDKKFPCMNKGLY